MKTTTKLMMAAVLSLTACAGTPPPAASSPKEASASAAAKPDVAAAKTHLEQHVKYPATRKEVLAACADTPEFTAAQKLWFEQNLPEGNYPSAASVMTALKL